jgi:RND family efflux transporter MFP subunit
MQINIKQSPPLYLTLFFVVVGLLIWLFSPSADKHKKPPTPVIAVETVTITPKKYQVMISSFGRIEPRTQGNLVAQVSGQIIEVSPNFCDGCFFAEREVLVTIDPRDYEIQVDIAAAELANAEVNYAEQQVLAEQAVKDRKTLRKKGVASDFALHIPQLAAAKSQIGAAKAKLNKAKLDVERTQIRAPYYGRILTKSVDIGEVVSANTSLASMYSTDLVEVNLPIKDSELPLINLPEPATSGKNGTTTRAMIINKLGDSEQSWPAVLVRTAGAIDEQSQQLSVTAQIDNPYSGGKDGRRPLKIGQYVTAKIDGKTIPNAIVIPNAAIYQGSYVYLYKDGLLQHREVEIAWQNSTEALIRKGISAGEQLVLTPLGRVSSGTPVKILGAAKRKQGAGKDKASKAKSRKREQQQ